MEEATPDLLTLVLEKIRHPRGVWCWFGESHLPPLFAYGQLEFEAFLSLPGKTTGASMFL